MSRGRLRVDDAGRERSGENTDANRGNQSHARQHPIIRPHETAFTPPLSPSPTLKAGLEKVGATMIDEWVKKTGADGKTIVDGFKKM